ncbi:phage integrase (Site-specific recombinase) [Clostridium botulinum CFSAN001627]|uniref:Phage integrase (Site-specific recombinase) n=1 Tax=Clostridium botulinum CFSAN001627 TaxID=1232189 RepID=M1ZRR6_CLOBO|nr:phage integrase (Site-specific recombinase) [Clostridium botulinum CFSAN001627]EPS49537.1 phage integrase (Site-specific recombinase) [Clostridium botulinum A1 str. CFSAN002368]BDB01890.1 hypothetical protein CBOS2020_19640 [Clostridium botulinum]
MNRSGMKCVLYPRVSTEMQIDGFSLDGQINSLKRFADNLSWIECFYCILKILIYGQ